MALFRRNRRRDDIYDDLDDPEAEAGPADAGDLNDAFEDDYEDEEPGGSIAGLVSKVLATVVISGLFVGVLLYAYSWSVGQRTVGESEVPLVEAQPGPEKVKPEDPGGMDVPYQDQLVLNQGEGGTPGEVERLLPPPESPQPVEQGSATEESQGSSNAGTAAVPGTESDIEASESPAQTGPANTSASQSNTAEQDASPDQQQVARTDTGRGAEDGDSLAPQGETANAAPDAATDPETATGDDEAEVPRPPGSKPTPPRDTAATVPETQETAVRSTGANDAARSDTTARQAAPGDILIQLAAFQQRDNAEAAWQRMQGKHASLLGAQALQLQRVRIEDKGVFWRVRTGPFPNRATAEDLCGQLKRQGQPCLVVRK
jgi:cell division septation protein DedD